MDSAIIEAQHALKKNSVDSATAKVPGQDQRNISAAVSRISLHGGFDAENSGAGGINAAGFIAKNARLHVSGAGNITVSVTEKVKARISGAGDVRDLGNPPIRDVKVSGAGEINFK